MITSLSDRVQKILRAILLVGFVAIWIGVALWSHGPRAFWTGFFPILPAAIVLLGFHSWRVICPLAAFNRFAARIPRAKQRRVGPWLEKNSYLVSLGALTLGLTIRLLFINGDGLALGIFLAAISLAAFVVGLVYTGKTWCNFFCPVGIVEKIYTEPANLYAMDNSQCPKCTACKKHCPDIDEENHYWKELESPSRRTAYFAFPGLVWGFYTAFALPRGTIQDYFSGAWTRVPHQYALATAPGLFFANVPRFVVMPAHLLLCMGISLAAFSGLEVFLAKRTERQRARHLALTIAAFTAFSSFYFFAGQPTYRKLGGLPALVTLFTAAVATLALARRWRRAEEDYVQERSVKKILAKWSYAEAPPKDPREVFAFVKSKERERDKVLAVYADAVHEVLADGVVEQSEQRLLEKLRNEFGITKAEHDKVMARLSAEDRALFEPGRAVSIEQVTQERGYRLALQNLLPTRPTEQQLEALRRSYGVDRPVHDKLLAELRSGDSPLRARALEQLDAIDGFRRVLAAIGTLTRVRAFQLLALVLLRRQTSAVATVLEFVGVVCGDEARLHSISARLFADGVDARTEGLAQLAAIDAEIARRLESPVLHRRPEPDKLPDGEKLQSALVAMLGDHDPMLAGAAVVALAVSTPNAVAPKVATLVVHDHPFVRESAVIAASLVDPNDTVSIAKLADDRDARVRATVNALLGEGARDSRGRGLAAEVTARAAANLFATVRDGQEATLDDGGFANLPTPERMLVLAAIPLFADLEPEQLYDIAVLATERSLGAGENLCVEGEPGEEVFVVIAGAGEIFTGAESARNIVGRVKASDCVGELAVLDEAPRSATVRATAPMRVLAIQGHAFRDLLSRQPDLSNAVIAMITRRLRGATQRASIPR